jgi:Zn-dependent M28 family amino/carboxypeptidase
LKNSRFITVSSLLFSGALSAQVAPPAVKAATSSVDPEKIRAHVKFLSDDLLEGRGPGTRGGEIAAEYIATQFALYGLKPAGDNGTYMQMVNFVGTKTIGDKTHFSFVPDKPKGGGMSIMLHSYDLTYANDYTVNNRRLTESVDINAPIVFVGYGVVAPEYGWDDYAGIDVKDKVVLCIVGDPPSDDPKFFGGKALTYYGRWTYKFEEAARHGAIGALVIHRTDLASYGWDVVKNSNTSEKTYLRDNKDPQLAAASWITLDSAGTLFHAANLDRDKEMEAAGHKGFKAIALPVSLEAHIEAKVRSFQSPNVVATIPGANVAAGKPDQAVMYTAHYDHLGIAPGVSGDNIYNGAADNATGVGMLLEMARAWSTIKTPLPHSVLFASVAAEEQGLLGSEYLGQHPPVPAAQIALDINYDMILPVGVPLEVNLNGEQRTTFHSTVLATAKRFNLTVVPEAHPEAGGYYRSDHFSLSRVGIPAFSVDQGELFEGHDRAWGEEKSKHFVDNDYHNFSDNYHADWDFKGNAKLVQFGIDLGWQAISSAPNTIEWHPGDEFEAARKASQK